MFEAIREFIAKMRRGEASVEEIEDEKVPEVSEKKLQEDGEEREKLGDNSEAINSLTNLTEENLPLEGDRAPIIPGGANIPKDMGDSVIVKQSDQVEVDEKVNNNFIVLDNNETEA